MSIINIVKNLSISSGGIHSVDLSVNLSSALSNYKGIMGDSYTSNGFGRIHDRYGLPAQQIPAKLPLQATDWSKKVTVTGLLNDSTVYEQVELWVRVYRELRYSLYQTEKKYTGPYKLVGQTFVEAGSFGFPGGSSWGTHGKYQVWWIVFTGTAGSRGFLIDFSNMGISGGTEREIDKNSFAGSPRTNGLYYFHNYSDKWNSTYGYNFHTNEADNIYYYVNDAPAQAPMKNTEVLASPPVTIRSLSLLRAPNVNYVEDRASYRIGSDARGVLPGAQANNSYKLVWSNVDVTINGNTQAVAVAYEDHQRLVKLKTLASPPVQPTQLGSTALVSSGAGANWVRPNMAFSTDPTKGSPSVWAPNLVVTGAAEKYIHPIVVDGASLTNSIGSGSPYESGKDSTWTPSSSNPDDYWYVLPRVQRSLASGCCANVKPDAFHPNALAAIGDFNSASTLCHHGRHWGKFLKSTSFPALGFSQADVGAWINFIEAAGEKSATGTNIGTQFNGYVYGSHSLGGSGRGRSTPSMGSPIFMPVSFTLEGLPQFAGYKSAVTISGGGGPVAADPVDKTIKDTLNAALSKKRIWEWTADGIISFARDQSIQLGKPLSELKSELLSLFFDAKTTWLMDEKNQSYSAALSTVSRDPVYKALVGLFVSTTPSGGSSSSGGASGNAGNPPATNAGNQKSSQTKTNKIAITVTRGLPGYRAGVQQSALKNDRPELVQVYDYINPETGETVIGEPRRFEFPFVPNQVNYSGLGAQWTEIERTGNFPIVDWTSFQLLKISFNFDVVDRQLENKTGFGLYWSCEDQIRTLREMAQSPYPVTFLNMDQFMSDEIRYPLFTRGRGIEFVIAEFSVTAVQRTPSKSPLLSGTIIPNQISRATCSMTLQEIPIEAIDIVQMPPIKPCNKKKKKCEDIPDTEIKPDRTYLLFNPGMLKG